MTTNIYYNFPQITLSLDGVDKPHTAEIVLSTNEQPITNIQLNDENYSAYSVSIYGQGNNPSHLIVKCYANVNDTASNLIYLAIPLILNANNGADPYPPPTSRTGSVSVGIPKAVPSGTMTSNKPPSLCSHNHLLP